VTNIYLPWNAVLCTGLALRCRTNDDLADVDIGRLGHREGDRIRDGVSGDCEANQTLDESFSQGIGDGVDEFGRGDSG
jgi:hypothetical protein